MNNKQLERFLAKVSQLSNGCWEWSAGRAPNGYGKFKLDGATVGAHRVAYEFFVGPIEDGKEIDHLCRNRACVNPTHLEPVVHRVNVLRGMVPVRSAQTHLGKKYWLGRKHTAQTRAQMSAAQSGIPKSAEHRANLSAARLAMTHCRNGHEYTPENVYTTRSGGRMCRTCLRLNDRRAKERARARRAAEQAA